MRSCLILVVHFSESIRVCCFPCFFFVKIGYPSSLISYVRFLVPFFRQERRLSHFTSSWWNRRSKLTMKTQLWAMFLGVAAVTKFSSQGRIRGRTASSDAIVDEYHLNTGVRLSPTYLEREKYAWHLSLLASTWRYWTISPHSRRHSVSITISACLSRRHSRPQSPPSIWPVAGIESSGLVQRRKSVIHWLALKSSKSDWLRMRDE